MGTYTRPRPALFLCEFARCKWVNVGYVSKIALRSNKQSGSRDHSLAKKKRIESFYCHTSDFSLSPHATCRGASNSRLSVKYL